MFEPQDHPDDIPYPGAPPTRAVRRRRLHAGVPDGRAVRSRSSTASTGRSRSSTDFAKVPAGAIKAASGRAGGLLLHPSGHQQLHRGQSSVAANEDVSWLWNGPMGYGTFYVAGEADDAGDAAEGGDRLRRQLPGDADARRPGRRRSCASCASVWSITTAAAMPVGWTRLIFKNFEFPFVEDSDERRVRRRTSTPAISTRSTTCSCSTTRASVAAAAAAAAVVAAVRARAWPAAAMCRRRRRCAAGGCGRGGGGRGAGAGGRGGRGGGRARADVARACRIRPTIGRRRCRRPRSTRSVRAAITPAAWRR